MAAGKAAGRILCDPEQSARAPLPRRATTRQEKVRRKPRAGRQLRTRARTIRETEYTWEQIEEILAAGKARETFGEDGQITVQVEGIGTALLNILDYDKDKAADPDMRTMTLQFADLPFDEMPFDENGCNKWEKSSIRRNMNSIAFKERFEEGFRRLLVPVLKENGDRDAGTGSGTEKCGTIFCGGKTSTGERAGSIKADCRELTVSGRFPAIFFVDSIFNGIVYLFGLCMLVRPTGIL